MTEEQIKKGFWAFDSKQNWPPEAISYFEDYLPSEKLNLDITQLYLSSSKQKKVISIWCEKLKELTEVKYLWLSSYINQQIFDVVCNMQNLEGLWINWSGIKNIESIVNLKELKHFRLGSSSKLESISVIGNLNSLITLGFEQLNKITDFSVISNLTRLEGLGLNGSMWTAQKINTLKPIEKLINLKYLTTINSRIQDKSFEPILKLPNLIRFDSSWNYPASEFAKLKNMPNLKYGNIETSLKEIRETFHERQNRITTNL